MPISSYVIRCMPSDRDGVLRQLSSLPNVEAGTPTDSGIPVVTDTASTDAAENLGRRLLELPGVKSAVLVYHNFEDVGEESPRLPARFRKS